MWIRFVRDNGHEGPAKLTVLILARLWFCLASTPPATRAVIHSAAPTAPAPARRTPGAGGTKYNSVLWPEGLLHCHEHCLRTAAPNPAPPPSTGSARASSQASFMPFARTPQLVQSGAAGRTRPSPTALAVAALSPWENNGQPSSRIGACFFFPFLLTHSSYLCSFTQTCLSSVALSQCGTQLDTPFRNWT
jgi:hypothetical protein